LPEIHVNSYFKKILANLCADSEFPILIQEIHMSLKVEKFKIQQQA
jgi:hypothetical protein